MTGADLVAKILKSEGVDFMGVIPFNGLEEAGAKAGIRPLIFRQERVGVNLADGYSRISHAGGTWCGKRIRGSCDCLCRLRTNTIASCF